MSLAMNAIVFHFFRCSLSTSNKAIAAMLCSFYPKFPSTSMDNKFVNFLFGYLALCVLYLLDITYKH